MERTTTSGVIREQQEGILSAWEHALAGHESGAQAVRASGATALEGLAGWLSAPGESALRQIVRRPPWGDGDGPGPEAVVVTTALHTALRSVSMGDAALAGEIDRLMMALSMAVANEFRVREHRLQELATADELTGALNRRAVLEALDAEVSRSLRHGRQLSVLYLDVDLLKEVNDAMGHAAGDKVLLDIVSVVRRNTRASDRLGRMGGDEFVVVLPDTDRAGGAVVAEKLVRLITGTGNSVSIGVAGSPQTPANRQKLIDAADQAMRKAKSSGRRRFAVAG